ncbi:MULTISPECIES: TetR/AcrR family transcriptional regulator [unclassified Ekhidna]|jgi:AcrR family transcriptional regulator|uniref:TetR/AcrR family transcriptional regulator n=1 Tax=unclassified Ekhidna TaxID=2632188 RepID=UPI0032DE6098
MIAKLQIQLNPALYLRDPQTTELGQKIVKESIFLIDEIGFESFTFKKLSIRINSTEASIYRYFENKHRLLVYLIAWYWNYIEYRITFETHNISSPEKKLQIAIRFITNKLQDDDNFPGISESVLQHIVISESDKTYLTKNVDKINKEGLFKGYKSLCMTIASYMNEINPDFMYPRSLTSTCLEAAHQQIFFSKHLPKLSDIKNDKDIYERNFEFLSTLIFNTLKK